MKLMANVVRRYSVIMQIFIFAYLLPGQSIERASEVRLQNVVLKQEMFTLSAQYRQSVICGLSVVSPDGVEVNFDQLPPKIKGKVASLEMRIDDIEVAGKGAEPLDLIRIILSKPPVRGVRDDLHGLRDRGVEFVADPSWLKDLSFGKIRLECIAKNVSKMELAVLCADAFNCEFGVTDEGEILFRNETVEAKAKYPIYVIKSRGTSDIHDKSSNNDSGKIEKNVMSVSEGGVQSCR